MVVCDRQGITLIAIPRHQVQSPDSRVSAHVDSERLLIRSPEVLDPGVHIGQASIRRQCRTPDSDTVPRPVRLDNLPTVEVVLGSAARHHLPARAARSVTLGDNRELGFSRHNQTISRQHRGASRLEHDVQPVDLLKEAAVPVEPRPDYTLNLNSAA